MIFNPIKSKKIIIFFLILAVIVVVAYSILKYTKGIGLLPFGGKVLTSIPCTCSGNFLLTISPPVGGQFSYIPGSQAYLNYNLPSVGVWALGLYTPGTGICTIFVGKGCVPFGVPIGTITPTVGTSLVF
ncbi:MAG: hypothetical protein AAB635_02160 [Patescibacteria group bacterium]